MGNATHSNEFVKDIASRNASSMLHQEEQARQGSGTNEEYAEPTGDGECTEDASSTVESGNQTDPTVGADSNNLPIASQVEQPPPEQRVTGETATPVDLEEVRRWAARKRRFILIGFVAVAAVTLAVVLQVTLGTIRRPSWDNGEPTLSPTSHGFAALQSLIESVSFDNGAALSDPSSPQFMALTWLASDAHVNDHPDWRLIQRYVLAVVYYSLGGDGWLVKHGWMNMHEDECTWFVSSPRPKCDENGALLRIVLFDNNVAGTLPAEIGILSDSLVSIGFQNDMLTGTIPTELGLLTNIEAFWLHNTELTGTIPTELGQFTSSTSLGIVVSESSITGTIPTEVVGYPHIETLGLFGNNLTGSIPTQIGTSSKVEFPLPRQLGENLEFLDLSRNRLTGTLPTTIGDLNNLVQLHLDTNALTGSVPTEMLQLTNLDVFLAFDNNFTGPFMCPDYIATCLVSCGTAAPQCRMLE